MKKIILIILTTISLFSCSSDDSSNNQNNNIDGFYIGNNFNSTNNGYFTHESDGTGYKNLIILTDGTVNSNPYDADNINLNNYSNNTSNLLILTVNSTSTSSIEEGTYNLDTTQYAGSGNLYWATFIAGITINNNLIDTYNYESYTSNSSTNPITSGSLTITKNGTIYNLNYTFQQNGSTINGSYVGELFELEYTE